MNARQWLDANGYAGCTFYVNEGSKHGMPKLEIEQFLADWGRAVLAEAERAHRWIPVSEKLPDDYGQFLVAISGLDADDDPYMGVREAGWDVDEGWLLTGGWNAADVKYWKPMERYPEAADLLAGMRGDK